LTQAALPSAVAIGEGAKVGEVRFQVSYKKALPSSSEELDKDQEELRREDDVLE